MWTRLLLTLLLGCSTAQVTAVAGPVSAAVKSDLRTAAVSGNLKKVKQLLKAHPSLINEDVGAGRTPLYHAAMQGRVEIVAYLLSQDARARTYDKKKIPLLYNVCRSSSQAVSTARVLLDHGALVDEPGPEGRSPLYAAALGGDKELVALLLKYHANVNAKSARGSQRRLIHELLARAASRKKRPDYAGIVTTLLEHEPDLSGCLQITITSGLVELTRALLAHGANVEEEMVEYSRSRRPEPPSYYGNRPLHRAVQLDRVEIARLLLDHKAQIDARNDFGQTPLHVAATSGKADMVRLLLKAGASRTVVDVRGQTALELAQRKDRADVVELLRK
jgi:ankyrin repeat protein